MTAPHKADAARATQGDDSVQRTGAANCLRWDGESVKSTNTDLSALKRLLALHVGKGETALVLGAGGAARAAIVALQDLGATVTFTSRDRARADAVAKATGARWVPWAERGAAAPRPRVVVQATPLGREPADERVLDPTGVRVAVELVYGGAAEVTRFEREAAAAGATVVSGRQMLLEQAKDAYRFWFGSEPDAAAMAKALVA